MKGQLLVMLTVIMLTSAGRAPWPDEFSEGNVAQTEASANENKIDNALAFINGYTENCNKRKEAVATIEWVDSSGLTTKSFRKELKRIIENAFKQDPELGLGFDPVFDAQDYPDEGFEPESFDEETNCLIVKGKDWPEFKLTIKIAQEKGRWLVDGCGAVNIPKEKRWRL